MCFILFTIGMPILYALNECRKLRLRQLERGNVVQDALYQEEPQEPQETQETQEDSSDSSDLEQPLDDTPLTEAESANEITANISVQYRGRIDVKKMLESLVTDDKFKETSVDLDKILNEIINQQKTK
jgi:hypothetical protein